MSAKPIPIRDDTTALSTDTGPANLLERWARDPAVNVEKLKELYELWAREQRRQAEVAFQTAFAEMQGELPTIDENGRAVMNGQTRYTYADQTDIVELVKPILQAHGFALRFRHKYQADQIKIIGILSHRAGHAEQDEFQCPADKTGSKNDIQAIASTRTYGQRYTTRALLNIVSRDPRDPAHDTDGHRQTRPEVKTPEGFAAWWDDMQCKADEGTAALQKAWQESKLDFRAHLISTNKAGWEQLKKRAGQVRS
jgi:hypothetical protein